MCTYGYCRISRKTQNIERQVRNIIESYPAAHIVKEAYTGTKIEGRKERYSDDSLRPFLDPKEYCKDEENNPCTALIASLGRIHSQWKQDLVYGDYRQLVLTNQQYAFARGSLIVAVNNSDSEAWMNVESGGSASYVGLLSKRVLECSSGRLDISLPGCSGDIFAPVKEEERSSRDQDETSRDTEQSAAISITAAAPQSITEPVKTEETSAGGTVGTRPESGQKNQTPPESTEIPDIPYDQMTVQQLQAVILSRLAQNGPVTDRMRQDVTDNIWHDSLVNWARSF